MAGNRHFADSTRQFSGQTPATPDIQGEHPEFVNSHFLPPSHPPDVLGGNHSYRERNIKASSQSEKNCPEYC